MLNSGKKIRALRDKLINILTLVLSEKKIMNETKNHPSLQVKWSVPMNMLFLFLIDGLDVFLNALSPPSLVDNPIKRKVSSFKSKSGTDQRGILTIGDS